MDNMKTASKKINFAAINSILKASFGSHLKQWLPDGKKSGSEYSSINPTRSDSHAGSFTINIQKGVWSDFATGDSGSDPVSLYAYLFHNNDQGAAGKELGTMLGVSANTKPEIIEPKKLKSEWVAILPPLDVPEPPKAHVIRGIPKSIYAYRNFDGQIIGYVYLFTKSDGSKDAIPLTWCENFKTGKQKWHWKGFEIPRVLYGLDRLYDKPDAMVLVVEGEKCADIAAEYLPDMVCMTWSGGVNCVDKSDWQPLANRNVIIWPDCDAHKDKEGVLKPEPQQPGVMAGNKIAQKLLSLGCKVWMVNIPAPGTKKPGYDIVDAIDEGLTGYVLQNYLYENTRRVSVSKPPKQKPKPEHDADQVSSRARLPEPENDEDQGSSRARRTSKPIPEPEDDADQGSLRARRTSKPIPEPENDADQGSLRARRTSKPIPEPEQLPPISAYENDIGSLPDTPKTNKTRKEKAASHVGDSSKSLLEILKRYIFLKNHNRIYDTATRNELTREGFDGAFCHLFPENKISMVFLNDPECIKVDGLIYLPGETLNPVNHGVSVLWNIWTNPGVKLPDHAVKEDVEKWLEHVNYLYPNKNEQEHLLDWMAHVLQFPQIKINHALLVAGTSRIGKDMMFNPLRYGLGEANVCEPPAGELKESFTDYLHHSKLVIFQEIQTFEGLNLENKLKPMLAAPPDMLRVRLFGRGFYETPNLIQAIFMSNYRDALHISAGDGRYFAIWTDKEPLEPEYYTELATWQDAGGNGLVVRWLLDRPINHFNPKQPAPKSEFKDKLLETSKSPLKHLLEDMIAAKDYPFNVDCVRSVDVAKILRDKYSSYSSKAIGSVMSEIGCLQKKCRRTTDKREEITLYAVRNFKIWGADHGKEELPPLTWLEEYDARSLPLEEYEGFIRWKNTTTDNDATRVK